MSQWIRDVTTATSIKFSSGPLLQITGPHDNRHSTRDGNMACMSDRPWWSDALQWALWAVAVSFVSAWLTKIRGRSRPSSQARQLVHPISTLVVGGLVFTLFAGSAVVCSLIAAWWMTAFFLGFAIMGIPLLLAYFLSDTNCQRKGSLTKISSAFGNIFDGLTYARFDMRR
jgi:hypothetical protein